MRIAMSILLWVAIIVLVFFILFWASQCQSCQMFVKDVKSDVTGLTRTVTLYANDGSVIRSYTFTGTIDTANGIASFNDANGKRVLLSGTYLMEEK